MIAFRKSLASSWRARYLKDRAGYKALLQDDPFKNWQRSRDPVTRCIFELKLAVDVFCAGEQDLGHQFLHRVISVSDRALAEKKYTSPLGEANLFRSRACSRGILGHLADGPSMTQAADILLRDVQDDIRRGDWDPPTQAHMLGVVRLNLLLGRRPPGASLVAMRRKFSSYPEDAEILRGSNSRQRLPYRCRMNYWVRDWMRSLTWREIPPWLTRDISTSRSDVWSLERFVIDSLCQVTVRLTGRGLFAQLLSDIQ